jgi:hypothetical protein
MLTLSHRCGFPSSLPDRMYSPQGLTVDLMHNFYVTVPKNLPATAPVVSPLTEYFPSELFTSSTRMQLSLEWTSKSFISKGIKHKELIASPYISGFSTKLIRLATNYEFIVL